MGPDDCSFNSINNFISNCKVEDGKQKVQQSGFKSNKLLHFILSSDDDFNFHDLISKKNQTILEINFNLIL